MALNAYPEAYPELKRLLLLLLHPAIPASSDAGGLWSQQAKQELADIVYYTVRSLLGGWAGASMAADANAHVDFVCAGALRRG